MKFRFCGWGERLVRPGFLAMLLVAVAVSARPAQATIILQGYNAASHDRFVNDSAFIGNPYDWSGVGRGTSDHWATMISPSYFLSAEHYHAGSGATIRFYHTNDPSGGYEERTVASGIQIGDSDLWLGKLTAPVSSNVSLYPILDLPTAAAYENQIIYTFGRTPILSPISQRLGRNVIEPGSINLYNKTDPPSSLFNAAYIFRRDNPGLGADESYLQPGDSGGPSFIISGGSPALVGIHWGIDKDPLADYSFDTFIPYYLDEIRGAMTEALVPEPGTGTLALLGLGFAGRRVGRLRRKAA